MIKNQIFGDQNGYIHLEYMTDNTVQSICNEDGFYFVKEVANNGTMTGIQYSFVLINYIFSPNI